MSCIENGDGKEPGGGGWAWLEPESGGRCCFWMRVCENVRDRKYEVEDEDEEDDEHHVLIDDGDDDDDDGDVWSVTLGLFA